MSTGIQPDPYAAKADFSDIYDQPDPRAYYRTLGALDYEIPAHGVPVFDCVLDEMGGREGKTVLDICCSYGVNAALLNHDLELDDLCAHYADADPAADAREMAARDREWFASHRRPDAVATVGLDVAGNAVRYATSVGLLDRGVVVDLESAPGEGPQHEALGAADLVTITGGVGYVGAKTFRAVVEASGDDPPWIAALSLRWVDFDPIAETLDGLGLVTERLEGYCVPQRRFADDEERQGALSGVLSRGLDPTTELRLDAHCAELFLARPSEAVRDAPIDDVFGSLTNE